MFCNSAQDTKNQFPIAKIGTNFKFTNEGDQLQQQVGCVLIELLLIAKQNTMTSRIEQLQAHLEEDPADPFNLYALALEYRKTDTTKAIVLFSRLLELHPDYVPTYYQLAETYQQEGRNTEALETYSAGIAVAQKMGDQKALRELRAAQELLLED